MRGSKSGKTGVVVVHSGSIAVLQGCVQLGAGQVATRIDQRPCDSRQVVVQVLRPAVAALRHGAGPFGSIFGTALDAVTIEQRGDRLSAFASGQRAKGVRRALGQPRYAQLPQHLERIGEPTQYRREREPVAPFVQRLQQAAFAVGHVTRHALGFVNQQDDRSRPVLRRRELSKHRPGIAPAAGDLGDRGVPGRLRLHAPRQESGAGRPGGST